jgi:hypothetical protein
MMTILVVQQRNWSDRLAVNTQTYDLALMIRQAQIYGLGVREFTAGTGNKFDAAYGVYVDISTLDRYYFFADQNKNGRKDAGEEVETKMFTQGVSIEKMCGFNTPTTERCYPTNGIEKVGVTFYRPQPQAIIKFFNSANSEDNSVGPPTNIYLKSAGGIQTHIKIEANGQVSIIR